MTFDLVIRGGTVVDGTGAPARTADVAITGDRIEEVGRVDGAAKRTIDADGLLVTPGFVDIHTHYDGQITWDPLLTPTCWHGVTTVVMGNCGVGFAPARRDSHAWLVGLMEGVEDIPGTALHEGIRWEWETFPEYLDHLAGLERVMDFGTQVPHGAVRAYVMGERGAKNQPASADDIVAMARIVKEGVAAGALGVLHVAHLRPQGHRRRVRARHHRRGRRGPGHRVDARRARAGRRGAGARRRGRGRPQRARAGGGLDARAGPAHRPARHVRPRAAQRRPRGVADDAEAGHPGARRRRTAVPPGARALADAPDRAGHEDQPVRAGAVVAGGGRPPAGREGGPAASRCRPAGAPGVRGEGGRWGPVRPLADQLRQHVPPRCTEARVRAAPQHERGRHRRPLGPRSRRRHARRHRRWRRPPSAERPALQLHLRQLRRGEGDARAPDVGARPR